MDNYLLMPYSEEAEKLSRKLGFSQALFLDGQLELVEGNNPKKLLSAIAKAKSAKKITVYRAHDEHSLRFVLEKTPADIIFGIELMHQKDSVHYPRSGLNQVLCKIAAARGKIIAFSVSDLLRADDNRPQLLRRMGFNIMLCRKYKVQFMMNNFSRELWEMRSAHDLKVVERVLGMLA